MDKRLEFLDISNNEAVLGTYYRTGLGNDYNYVLSESLTVRSGESSIFSREGRIFYHYVYSIIYLSLEMKINRGLFTYILSLYL